MPIALKPILERKPASDATVHENPVMNRILLNRGIETMADMTYSLEKLIDPFLMENMQASAELLEKHLRKQSRVVVIGDFDCDGATSSAIATEGLRLLGFKDVHYMIPDRTVHGYGLTPAIVNLAGELEPNLIVTVDSGIANIDGALAVKALPNFVELLITDHHLASEKGLPDAECIVNPNQPTCPFPSKNLAGCGVMFYTIMALRAHLRRSGYFEEMGISQPNIMPLIDLVALGTVADVVILDLNNRILVDAGLKRIREGKGRPGIMALLAIAGKDYQKITAQDFGFAIGPRINAAGRLEQMDLGVDCLLSKSLDEAMVMAERLNELNLARRDIEASHVIDANLIIEKHNLMEIKGVVIHDPTWNPGVVGIVSSRIKDKMNRPVICMTDTEAASNAREHLTQLTLTGAPAEEIAAAEKILVNCDVKGSARSIEGIHLKHLLDKMYKKNPDLLSKFGGHAMAAGLSLPYRNLLLFMSEFNGMVAKEITEDQLRGSINVDIMNIAAEHITMDLAKLIKDTGPWGQGFLEPVFHGRFKLESFKPLSGDKHLKMVVTMIDNPGIKFDAIAFGCMIEGKKPINTTFDASFSVDINEFRGRQTLQLMVKDIQDPEFIHEYNRTEQLINEAKASVQSAPSAASETRPVDQKMIEAPKQEYIAEVRSDAKAIAQEQSHIRTDDPEPRESKIQGLSTSKGDNPVAKLREELQAMVAKVKNQSVTRRNPTADDSPAPF